VDTLTNLNGRLRRIGEVPITAILHAHLYLIGRLLTHSVLNTVTGNATTHCSCNGGQNTSPSATYLVSKQAAGDGPADCAEPCRRLRRLNCIDGDDFSRVRVGDGRPRCRRF
jgi:hypothetical protein